MIDLASVDAEVKEWRQGDVFDHPWALHVASGNSASTSASRALPAEESDARPVATEAEGLVVVTQSCDVTTDVGLEPYVECAPLVRLDADAAKKARKRYLIQYAAVPALGPDAFADLDLITTLEKSYLSQFGRQRGVRDDHERRSFADAVARKRGRTALPDVFQPAISKLRSRILEKHARGSLEGQALEALHTILVAADPDWEADEIEVQLTFSPRTREEALRVATPEQWLELVDGWLQRCEPQKEIVRFEGVMIPLDEISVSEFLNHDELDLRFISDQRAD